MKNNFQLIVLVAFVIAAVFGILVFSGAIPLGGSKTTSGSGTVTLWGTVKTANIGPALESFNSLNQDKYVVRYIEKDPDTFDKDLLEALASGQGPDMFFMPSDLAFHYANKIFTIPYGSYPLVSFQSNFAGAGEVFLTQRGILAFPLTIDPLIMYYNRSILDANNIVYPPKDWEEFLAEVPLLTKKDDSNKILKNATALGQFSNVVHAKDILAALFMQLGDKIVSEKDGQFLSVFGTKPGTDSVLNFYTDFANPGSPVYSWNKSFANSQDYFSTENLAFYFGFASELPALVAKNPNQNFQVAPIPQIKNAPFKLTGANVTGIALSVFSKNFSTAFIAASQMATGSFAKNFAEALGVAPARRDLLVSPPKDAYSPTFYASSLYARSWLDPSPKDTDNVFRNMVDGVLSNSMTPQAALRDASAKIDLLLRR